MFLRAVCESAVCRCVIDETSGRGRWQSLCPVWTASENSSLAIRVVLLSSLPATHRMTSVTVARQLVKAIEMQAQGLGL